MNMARLLARKKGSLCIVIGLCVISVYIILGSDHQTGKRNEESYAVSIRHYGVDAREMERGITIPLEDALFSIPGVVLVQSSSENSLSRVFIRFKNRRKYQYEAVREAAQRIYETLPPSVQRPEIQSSDNSMIPVWAAAFYSAYDNSIDTAIFLEKILKPKLESLEGSGEVHVSGGELKEIIVAIDQEKAAALGLSPASIAWTLGMNDALFTGGTMFHEGKEIIVTVDGRYGYDKSIKQSDASSLNEALITIETGTAVKLSDIAVVYERDRMPDTISRVNGMKTAVVSIMGNAGADLRKLSRDIKRELESGELPLTYLILSDKGAQEASAFNSVFAATLQGSLLVAFICYFLNRGRANSLSTRKAAGLFCAFSVPAVCLISIAVLSLCGFPPNRFVLAGIAAGLGAAIDPVILCCAHLRGCSTYKSAGTVLKELSNPLIAGALTTIAALIPLMAMKNGEETIVWAIGVVTLTALVLSLGFLPPLMLWGLDKPVFGTGSAKRHGSFLHLLHRKIFRKICRCLAINIRICVKHPVLVCGAGLLLTIAGIAALVIRGTDPATAGSEDSVYGHIEFEGGLLTEETDRLLAEYGKALAENPGVINVQTGARTGSGFILVSYNPKHINADKVMETAMSIPVSGGFVYFPETSTKNRHWAIKISGDDDGLLRDMAGELAYLCKGSPLIKEVVLNFKEGSKKITLLPNREKAAETGLSFFSAANTIRTGIYGPVVYKRKSSAGEIDVRVKTATNQISNELKTPHREDLDNFLLFSDSGYQKPLRLNTVLNVKDGTEPSSIKRENRRRIASVTITTMPLDPRRVKAKLEGIFKKLKLPPGYTLEFDPEAIGKAQSVSGVFVLFIIALCFCYIVIAALNESFLLPIVVLAAIPPSLAVPALFIAILNNSFNSQIACAFVVVSGMAVNAAVLCASGLNKITIMKNKSISLYSILRDRLPSLLSTTFTTICGALPFIFLREGVNSFIRNLSLVATLGVSVSCLCAISIVPAAYLLFYFRQKNNPVNH